jgi:hypothetical protein
MGLWFSQGPPVSSTNKADRHEIRKCVLAQLKNPMIVGLVGWFYGV